MAMRKAIAFFVGGMVFAALQPFLATLSVSLIVMLAIIIAVLAFTIPGGWLLGYMGARTLAGLLAWRTGRLILLSTLLALVVPVLGSSIGYGAGTVASFVLGGILGLLALSHLSLPGRREAEEGIPRRRGGVYVRLGSSGPFSREGLTEEDVRGGVLVTGIEAPKAVRAIVDGLASRGKRVLILGTESMVPETVEAKAYDVCSLDVAGDLMSSQEYVEAFVYSLALAARLRNDDLLLLLRSAAQARQRMLEGRSSKHDLLRVLSEGFQDPRRQSVVAAALSSVRSISSSGISTKDVVAGGWKVLLIKASACSQRDAAFMRAYALLAARRLDAALVLEDPELLLVDISLLPYDSRESWEGVFNVLKGWRGKGLILVSRGPVLSDWVYRLCRAYVVTRLGGHVPRPEGRARGLMEASRELKQGEALIAGGRGTSIAKLMAPEPARLTFIRPAGPADS
ncbi:MAG: hypothetical protein B9J98_00905 [Candidatus Terraquivivens tikiterensis]|uniref:Uncharacterized protein n=1 Tax=Candidatus Terraquivivens tikiterensis TaxID=1980982 RepID=A0A2R7Y9I2_9ARCH|nr:MAG: hypothetical protein B9J98_00905 [Candidatus Terraquivivens tikiterensis]